MKKMIDLTLELSEAREQFKGLHHLGTHIDIMDTGGLAPERFISKCHLIQVVNIFDREIQLGETGLSAIEIEKGDSIIFHTGWMKKYFKTDQYFKDHAYISFEIIQYLISKQVNLIGIDAPGIRRTTGEHKHYDMDVLCSQSGVFNLENLCCIEKIEQTEFKLYCFPLSDAKSTGTTCRVIAEME